MALDPLVTEQQQQQQQQQQQRLGTAAMAAGRDISEACISAAAACVPPQDEEEARALLRAAQRAFVAGSAALRGAPGPRLARGVVAGHSAAQRQMANAVTALRHMHVMEDVSSGEREEEEVWCGVAARVRCGGATAPIKALGASR